jgi:hypothetical protein
MAGNYEINKVNLVEEYGLLRVPEIKVEGSTIVNLSRAVSKKLPNSFITNVYLNSVKSTFYEVFMRIDLDRLRNIDSDSDARQAFIDSRFPPNIAADGAYRTRLIPLIILVLDIKVGDKLLDTDIDYINDILTWVSNKIYVTPILRFADGINRTDRLKFYEDFLKRLLISKKTLPSGIRASASVPTLYPPSKIPEILEKYSGENKPPSFVVIDFDRNRMTSSRMIGATNGVRRYFRKEEGEEPKYALYAFNVKPYKKGAEASMAEDIGCYLSGISIIGDSYRMSPVNKIYIPPALKLSDLPKIFDAESYKYDKLNKDDLVSSFNNWYEDLTDKKIGPPYNKYSPYVYRFNVQKTSDELNKLSTMVIKGEKDSIKKKLNGKEIVDALKGKMF